MKDRDKGFLIFKDQAETILKSMSSSFPQDINLFWKITDYFDLGEKYSWIPRKIKAVEDIKPAPPTEF